MPATAEIIDAHIGAIGAYMFHVTDRDRADAVLAGGMRPDSESSEKRPYFEPRPDRIYLSSLDRTPLVVIEAERVVLRVNLRLLDPDCFDTDEDRAWDADNQGSPWVSVSAPRRELTADGVTEVEGQQAKLAAWAETTPGFDDPPIVAKSLAAGSVAYRGTVPTEALQEASEPSAGAETFARAAAAKLGLEPGTLGDVPLIDDQHVELARAYEMAKTVIESATGEPLPADLRDDYGARQVYDQLHMAARSDDVGRRTLFLSAAHFADSCQELGDLPGLSNIATFLELAESAADLLGVIESWVSAEAAVSAAQATASAIRIAKP